MSMAAVFYNYSPPCVLRQSLSVSLEFEVLARLAAGKSPGDIDIYTHALLTFYKGTRDQIQIIMFAWQAL